MHRLLISLSLVFPALPGFAENLECRFSTVCLVGAEFQCFENSDVALTIRDWTGEAPAIETDPAAVNTLVLQRGQDGKHSAYAYVTDAGSAATVSVSDELFIVQTVHTNKLQVVQSYGRCEVPE